MNKKLLAMLDNINALKEEVRALADAGDLENAKAKKEELVKAQEAFDLVKDIEDAPVDLAKVEPVAAPEASDEDKTVDSVHAFAQAARQGFRVVNYNNETTGADGGYTVPQDILTQINKFKEARFSLRQLVDSETVTTLSGRRTFQARASHNGFSQVNESGAIGAVSGPSFSVLSYAIKKYAGYLPVTNELLADSDANITNTLIEWLGEEAIATENAQIISKINTKTITVITGLDGIKNAINVTLGQAFKGGIHIVTNDDGLNYLDTLKDSTGRYLLQPGVDPVNPLQMYLAVGASKIPVDVVPTSIMANYTHTPTGGSEGTYTPFVIGDLKEYCKLFDRQQLTLLQSNVATAGSGDNAVNAFEQDLTLFRGIMRLDCVVKDASAIVRAGILQG